MKKLNRIVDIATIIEHIKPEIVAFNISLKSTVFTTFQLNYNRWKLKSKGDENVGKEITFQTLPDTIGVTDYMKWRKCGRAIRF